MGSENEKKKEKGDQKEGKRPERWGDRDPDTGRAKDHERKGHRHRKRETEIQMDGDIASQKEIVDRKRTCQNS